MFDVSDVPSFDVFLLFPFSLPLRLPFLFAFAFALASAFAFPHTFESITLLQPRRAQSDISAAL